MKMKYAFVALLLSTAAAYAEGAPYAPCDYPGQYAHCPTTPTPQPEPTPTNINVKNKVAAEAKARAQALALAKQKQLQEQRQKQQQRQDQSQIANGGQGGKGGNARAKTGDIRNVGNTNIEAVANAPIMNPGNSMMGCTSGVLLTVSFGSCKADVFPYVRQAGGDRIALAHLANVHGPANKALRANGLAETADERYDRQTREARAQMMYKTYQPRPDRTQLTVGFTISYCTVVERHWNGVPKNINAVPPSSLPICVQYHGLEMVKGRTGRSKG